MTKIGVNCAQGDSAFFSLFQLFPSSHLHLLRTHKSTHSLTHFNRFMVIQHFWSAEVKAEAFTLFTQEGKKEEKEEKRSAQANLNGQSTTTTTTTAITCQFESIMAGMKKIKGKLKKAKTGRLAILRTMKTKGYQNVISLSLSLSTAR